MEIHYGVVWKQYHFSLHVCCVVRQDRLCQLIPIWWIYFCISHILRFWEKKSTYIVNMIEWNYYCSYLFMDESIKQNLKYLKYSLYYCQWKQIFIILWNFLLEKLCGWKIISYIIVGFEYCKRRFDDGELLLITRN